MNVFLHVLNKQQNNLSWKSITLLLLLVLYFIFLFTVLVPPSLQTLHKSVNLCRNVKIVHHKCGKTNSSLECSYVNCDFRHSHSHFIIRAFRSTIEGGSLGLQVATGQYSVLSRGLHESIVDTSEKNTGLSEEWLFRSMSSQLSLVSPRFSKNASRCVVEGSGGLQYRSLMSDFDRKIGLSRLYRRHFCLLNVEGGGGQPCRARHSGSWQQ